MVVVKQEHDLVREARELVEQRGQDNLARAGAHPEQFEERAAIPGYAFCSAATTYVQNRTGSLSAGSRETQAKRRGSWSRAIHSASRVVFPDPAGAPSSVSLRSCPADSASTRPVRLISLCRGAGTCSLVARRAPGTGLLARSASPPLAWPPREEVTGCIAPVPGLAFPYTVPPHTSQSPPPSRLPTTLDIQVTRGKLTEPDQRYPRLISL